MGTKGEKVDLTALRAQMAAMSGRSGQRSAGSADERPVELLPTPPVLADMLPHNGIPRGTVVAADGARSMLVAMIAAVSGAGGQVAVVGLPQLSLLSAVEMGADLSSIAVVADPGPDPVEIGGILLDGMDLVVLGLAGATVPPSRAKVLAGRARKQASVLLITDGHWPTANLRLHSRVTAHHRGPTPTPTAGSGYGRLVGWRLQLSVEGRGQAPATREIDCRPTDTGVQWSTVTSSSRRFAVAN